jgi:hypothetical protein
LLVSIEHVCLLRPSEKADFFFLWKTYAQQGRTHSRRLHPDWAARPDFFWGK